MQRTVCLMLAGFLTATPALASAPVNVTFGDVDHFTDAAGTGGNRAKARTATTEQIGRFLQELGARHLKPGQSLSVEVLDIDLAGEIRPWNLALADTRIMTGITWPRIKLRYTLTEGTAPARSAEETVVDMNYQMNPAGRFSSDPLVYEKSMLEDWFKARFVDGVPPPA